MYVRVYIIRYLLAGNGEGSGAGTQWCARREDRGHLHPTAVVSMADSLPAVASGDAGGAAGPRGRAGCRAGRGS